MNEALIGYTGFVGSNFDQQHSFSHKYNSKNIGDIAGQEFDLVVSAGARAEKWRINQDPETDIAELEVLKSAISQIKTKQFVLISTVDVYPEPVNVNEDTEVNRGTLQPYGLHRLQLEDFVRQQFPEALIIRLPGLFGPGLKKNVIFDLLTNNTPFLEQANTDSRFQYYNLANIWRDTKTALDAGVQVINFATEPVSTEEVAREAFGIEFVNHPKDKPAGLYDFKSIHANLYGGSDGYLYTKKQVLEDIAAYVKSVKAA